MVEYLQIKDKSKWTAKYTAMNTIYEYKLKKTSITVNANMDIRHKKYLLSKLKWD